MKQAILSLVLLSLLFISTFAESYPSQEGEAQVGQAQMQGKVQGDVQVDVEPETFDVECETAIVGAGMGGVYTAWRLVTAEDFSGDASKICLFERRDTHGGLMIPVKTSAGKTVEMGIEFYDTSMPFVNELVDFLGIPSECAFIYYHHEEEESVTPEDDLVVSPEEEITPEGAEMEQAETIPQHQQQYKTREAKQAEQINEPQAAVVATCEKISTAFWFFRNKVVTKDTLKEDINALYNLKNVFEKTPNLVKITFDAVFGDRLKFEDLLEMAREEDTLVRWESFASIIESIIFNEEITYNGIAINELSMDAVLSNLYEDHEWLRAAVDFSRFPGMKSVLSLNFEQFAVGFMRYLASGKGEVRKITSPEGMKTILDVMVEELKNNEVQIFYSSTLSDINLREDKKIVLSISEGERSVLTDRFILAISADNLKHLKYSEGLSVLSGETSEALGNLKRWKAFSGVLFYETAWWKELGLSGFANTDTRLEIIRYVNDDETCEETKSCALRFYTLEDTSDRLNTIDLVNMIDTCSPITQVSSDRLTWTPRDTGIISSLHKIVTDIHKDYPGFADLQISEPTSAFFGNYATDEVQNIGSFAIPSRLRLGDFLQAMINPAPGYNIHLINSDYSEVYHNPGSSMVMSERVLHNLLGLAKPSWIQNEIEYNHYTKVE